MAVWMETVTVLHQVSRACRLAVLHLNDIPHCYLQGETTTDVHLPVAADMTMALPGRGMMHVHHVRREFLS